METTLLLVKPDGVQRGLVGEILGRVERRGLRLSALKLMHVSRSLAEQHYAIHKGKPFYNGLIDYIVSAPVVAMAWSGNKAVEAVRQVLGATNPTHAAPGTVRADFAIDIGRNLTHGSDSAENGAAEVALWFATAEVQQWQAANAAWVFE